MLVFQADFYPYYLQVLQWTLTRELKTQKVGALINQEREEFHECGSVEQA